MYIDVTERKDLVDLHDGEQPEVVTERVVWVLIVGWWEKT